MVSENNIRHGIFLGNLKFFSTSLNKLCLEQMIISSMEKKTKI